MNISDNNLKKLDKVQSQIIKKCLGLSSSVRSTPLLLATTHISQSIRMESLDLLKRCILNDSLTKDFYCYVLNDGNCSILSGRMRLFCEQYNIDILQYVFNDTYARYVKNTFNSMFFIKTGCDGVIYSIRSLLYSGHYDETKRQFLKRLLQSF